MNPIQSFPSTNANRSRGGNHGGGKRDISTLPYFNRNPDMPQVNCRNKNKPKFASWCDDVTDSGRTICNGCLDAIGSGFND